MGKLDIVINIDEGLFIFIVVLFIISAVLGIVKNVGEIKKLKKFINTHRDYQLMKRNYVSIENDNEELINAVIKLKSEIQRLKKRLNDE